MARLSTVLCCCCCCSWIPFHNKLLGSPKTSTKLALFLFLLPLPSFAARSLPAFFLSSQWRAYSAIAWESITKASCPYSYQQRPRSFMSDPITTRKISSGISWRRWWFGIRISRLWPLKALPAFGFKQDTLHVPLSLDLYSCDPFCSSIYFDYLPYSRVKTAERLKFELPARPHRPPTPAIAFWRALSTTTRFNSVRKSYFMSMNLGYCSILPYLLTWLSCLLSDLFPPT